MGNLFRDETKLVSKIPKEIEAYISEQYDEIEQMGKEDKMLIDLGLEIEDVQRIMKAWHNVTSHSEYKGTKNAFYPNADSYSNLTKAFFEHMLERFYPSNYNSFLKDKLPAKLQEIFDDNYETHKQSIKEAQTGANNEEIQTLHEQNDKLYKKIAELQDERDLAVEGSYIQHKNYENLEHTILALVEIFKKNDIQDDLDDLTYETMMGVISRNG